ncbi:hypothetical protein ANCCAN_16478 [Ancylostoma caninum]|uniref:Uncharacterized protein n=1 Tax=Ancylostoma caninum TaxID=29170 RepID=A0A368G1M5_ANCCA|nr:hypothetical protein ANCCAN_16478 [Ancylostoma caninum]
MQTNHPFTQPVPPYDLLNQSASSAERDTMTPHTLLWEEAPRALSRNCATSPEDDFSHETSPFTKKGSSRGRRSGPSYDHPQGEKRREKKVRFLLYVRQFSDSSLTQHVRYETRTHLFHSSA